MKIDALHGKPSNENQKNLFTFLFFIAILHYFTSLHKDLISTDQPLYWIAQRGQLSTTLKYFCWCYSVNCDQLTPLMHCTAMVAYISITIYISITLYISITIYSSITIPYTVYSIYYFWIRIVEQCCDIKKTRYDMKSVEVLAEHLIQLTVQFDYKNRMFLGDKVSCWCWLFYKFVENLESKRSQDHAVFCGRFSNHLDCFEIGLSWGGSFFLCLSLETIIITLHYSIRYNNTTWSHM